LVDVIAAAKGTICDGAASAFDHAPEPDTAIDAMSIGPGNAEQPGGWIPPTYVAGEVCVLGLTETKSVTRDTRNQSIKECGPPASRMSCASEEMAIGVTAAVCPPTLGTDVPAGWRPYYGLPSVFHCGYRGILEDREPAPDNPQSECMYDESGVLVGERHPFAGCQGTANQYDAATHPLLHTFVDSGGIVRAGLPAFAASRLHELSNALQGLHYLYEEEYRMLRGELQGSKPGDKP